MRHLSLLGIATALIAILFAGASCSEETKFRALCSSDQACIDQHDGNPNWRCDSSVGDCVCTGDGACVGEAEHCELLPKGDGRCHPNVSCEWNPDCEGNAFCDVQNRHCRVTGCTDDLQCNFGSICDLITQACIPGCRSHGDCNLGDTCMCQDDLGNPIPCPTCDESDRSNCQIGACTADTCADDSFCRYGDFCVDAPNPAELDSCETGISPTRPYCRNCTSTPGEANRCGSPGPNYCLIDTSDPAGRASYCGVDCSAGQPCPNGFGCHDVLILTSAVCQSSAQCVPGPAAPTCEDDAGCPSGARCVSGKCAGTCRAHEGAQSGYCSCVQDSDCPQQTCGSDGRCEITREQCADDAQCRGQIYCVNNGSVGYCQIGRNCAPDEGVTCTDVRCDQDPTGCGG